MIAQGTTRRGRRCSTAKAFLRPVRLRKNLHISLFTFVHKVLIDRNDKAFAIKYEKHGRIGHAFAKKEIILSAGTIGSPTILMHSGIGPKEHLEEFGIPVIRDLPVGRNLQDHIGVFGLNFLAKKGLAFKQDRYEKLSSILKYYLKGEGPLTSIGGVEALAFMHTKYSNDSNLPDVEFHFIPGSPAADGGRHLWRAQGLPFEVYEEFYEPLLDKDVWTCLPMLLRPKSVGVIKLRSSNVYEYPLIYPNYLTHPLDTATLVEALKMMILMSETKAFREVGTRVYARPFPGCENHDLFSDKYFECLVRHTTQTIYHPVGTAKMGPSWDPEAVVDPELRVYGIKSLRVADCSIMPTIVSGNTNAPTIMIGERASDLIKAKWGYVA
ncbi:unnamed protein product [Notodromas monacha]|uniref:Glucose-methanol-choline oxidoreductase N-terminal domain-containing protein n=1 Tax=Notodromas monacha TaxID=399045 RepID=A0A7R9GDR3_9CRUS|nr:unnamed protein product [Notodromas monacha]CAG0918968.1 unnamed protein product [Notodromas monacha]